jgi:hypothetical protein
MTARVVSDDVQVTSVVRFCVVVSEYVPVAVKDTTMPFATLGKFGVMLIDCSPAPVTVTTVAPETLPSAAVIVELPAPVPVTSPWLPAVLLTVATLTSDDVHVTCEVRFCVVLSVYVPVAVMSRVVSRGKVGVGGVTAMLTKTALVTCSVVVPETAPKVAVMRLSPTERVDAKPAPLMVATAGVPEVQATWVVRSCVVLFEKLPVAVNCRVVPSGLEGSAGVIEIDDSVALVTVSVVEPWSVPKDAVIVVVPTARLVARPAGLMAAVATVLDPQTTVEVPGPVLLSE